MNGGLADTVRFSVGLLQRLSMTLLFVILLPIGPVILLFADGDIEALPVAAEWIRSVPSRPQGCVAVATGRPAPYFGFGGTGSFAGRL